MSMDEQFEQMKIFDAELDRFNNSLAAGLQELQKAHDLVSPLWQDEMRRKYDAIWTPFHERMEQYTKREAPAFTVFLRNKIRHLREYLHG